MSRFLEEEKAVGLVLDLSLRHESSGRRVVDVVKRELVRLVCEVFEDGLDLLYLYHPELTETVWDKGQETAAIGNYETDGWPFNLYYSLKQTLYVVGSQDHNYHNYRKYLLLVTDRMTDTKALEKAFFLNEKEMFDCTFIVVGVGGQYGREALESLATGGGALFVHVDEPSSICDSIKSAAQ